MFFQLSEPEKKERLSTTSNETLLEMFFYNRLNEHEIFRRDQKLITEEILNRMSK